MATTATMTKTSSLAATIAAPSQAMVAPRPKGKVNFVELSKLAFPRKCIFMLDSLHWPSLFFPNFEVMIHELEDLQDVIFEAGVLNVMAMDLIDAMEDDAEANTRPILLLLGIDQLIFAPKEENLLSFAFGVSKMMNEGKRNEDLDEAIKMAKELHRHCKGPHGRTRKAMRHFRRPTASASPSAASSKQHATALPPATPAAQTVSVTPAHAVKPVSTPAHIETSPVVADAAAIQPAPIHAPKEASIQSPEDKPSAEPVGTELLANAKNIYAGTGPLFFSPVGAVKRRALTKPRELIAPSEYKCFRGGPSVQEYAASIEVDAASKHREESEMTGSVSPSQYRMFQKGPSVEEFAASLNDAKQGELQKTFVDDDMNAKTSAETKAAVLGSTNALPDTAKMTEVLEVPEILSPPRDDPIEMHEKAVAASQALAAAGDSTRPNMAKQDMPVPLQTEEPKPMRGRPRQTNTTSVRTTGRTSGSRPKNRMLKLTPPSNTYLEGRKAVYLSPHDRQLPTFQEVKPALIKLGFTFARVRNGELPEFRFPGYNVDTNHTPDENVFTSLESFRARLCSHGLGLGDITEESLCDQIGQKPASKLERWIRLSIVKDPPTKLREDHEGLKHHIKALRELGFRFNDGGYSFKLGTSYDGVWRSKEKDYHVYLTEGDFFDKLSRFGLPRECRFEGLTDEVRTLLELQFSFEAREWINPEPLDVHERTTRRVKRKDTPSRMEGKMKKARKRSDLKSPPTTRTPGPLQSEESPVLVATRTSGPAVPVQHDMSAVGKAASAKASFQHVQSPALLSTNVSMQDQESSINKASSTLVTEPQQTAGAPSAHSPAVCDKLALAVCNSKPLGEESVQKDFSGRDISAEIISAGTSDDWEKLASCLMKLERGVVFDDNQSSDIVFGAHDSHFRRNNSFCCQILDKLVESRVSIRGKALKSCPAALYLCGAPGVGKTTAAKWCCRNAMKSFTSKNGDWIDLGIQPAFVEINCTQFSAGGADVKKKVLEYIWEACQPPGKEFNQESLLRMLRPKNAGGKKRFVFLVLDEIDQLVHADTETENPRTNGEKLLRYLSKLSSDPTSRLAIIGTGNAMNNNKYRRLTRFMQFHRTFSFQAYSEDEIESILRARVKGASVVEPKALSFIAKKTSNVKGDARCAIELLSTAIRNAKELREAGSVSTSKGTPYLIQMRDVVRLDSGYAALSTLIKGLATYGKFVVVAAVKLAVEHQNSGSAIPLRMRDLLSASTKFIEERHMDSVCESDIAGLITELDDIGLIKFERSFSAMVNDYDPFKFMHLPQEMELAAKEALGEDGIFNI